MSDAFVTLHRHDSYSLFDGLDVAERAAEHAKFLGAPALALTNHGNIFGLVEHHFACKARGIKALHGIEFYITDTEEKPQGQKEIHHITALVQTQKGYENVCKLVTKSYDLFYYKPRITFDLLAQYSEGLIVLSGCAKGHLQTALTKQNMAEAERLFGWFKGIFGDRFYAELQHHDSGEYAVRGLFSLASSHGVPVVFTNDAHYVEKEDKIVHDLILKLRRGDKGEDSPTYGEGFHILDRGQASSLLKLAHPYLTDEEREKAIDCTVSIAGRCAFNMEELKPPRLLPPLWEDAQGKLHALADEGLRTRGLERPEYKARLNEELRVIDKLGYDDYFLVCWEVTSWARQQGILIGPRGSVCGSLLAYVLGITQVDPLVHGTLFERFLHDQKKSLPDVDIDIDSRYRDRVMEWLLKRYSPYAIPIVTFGRYGEGNVASDLGEEFQLDEDDRQDLRKAIRELHWNRVLIASTAQLREHEVIRRIEKRIPNFVRIVQKLYGAAAYMGQHPGGVCFVPGEFTQWLAKVRYKDAETTSYHMVDVERLGLLKFDFLGLTALAVVDQAIDYIKERHLQEVTLESIPLDDRATLQAFAAGHTDAIFQFETEGGRAILREIEPEAFRHVVAANALNRPGVSDNLEAYVRGKNSGQKFSPYFAETYGAVVYQEQILAFLRALGFTWQEGDAFLKSIKGVKRYDPNMPAFKKFTAALMQRGVSEEKADGLLKRLTRYSFNKAHATAYSMVSYWQMWLRVHYPLEFWTSTIASEKYEDKQRMHERSALRDECIILPPHVNGSAVTCIEDNAIRLGLGSIKGVGMKAAETIVEVRNTRFGGKFRVAAEVAAVPQRVLTSKVVGALRKSGALEFDMSKWADIAAGYNKHLLEVPQRGWKRTKAPA